MTGETTEIVVRECAACLFRWEDTYGYGCLMNRQQMKLSEAIRQPPDWCPLRAGPVVVRLEVSDG